MDNHVVNNLMFSFVFSNNRRATVFPWYPFRYLETVGGAVSFSISTGSRWALRST